MQSLLLFAIAAVASLSSAPAAQASTLPRVDFQPGERTVAVGILDANVDWAVLDRLSIGASFIPLPSSIAWYDPILSPMSAALRATYRLGELAGYPVGVTLSTGIVNVLVGPNCPCGLPNPFPALPLMRWNSYVGFVQPAANITVPFKAPGQAGWTMRATLGPIFGYTPQSTNFLPLWPNLEFAYSWGERTELTLLGNALVGWRTTF